MSAPIRLVALASETLRAYPLVKSQTTVGSAPDNDVVIDHKSVSRRHAVIVRGRFGGLKVRDLDSTNGTRINGRRIAGARRIRPGDELEVGNARFAVMNSPRRSRALSVPAIAAIALIVTAAGFVMARYLVNLPFIPPSKTPARVPEPSRPEPAPAPIAKGVAPGSTREDGAPGVAPEGEGAAPASTESGGGPAWLRAVNHYRTMSGLPAVGVDRTLSAGSLAHARYLVKNGGSVEKAAMLGAEIHNEEPGNPWYSAEGLHAAQSGDVEQWWGTSPTARPPMTWAIDQWVGSTWHRMAILNPRLREVGYGEYCERGACAAVLDVLSRLGGAGFTRADAPAPIQFPPDGATVHLDALGQEWPNPLASCAGYGLPAGLPITLQLGAMVPARLAAFSLRHDSDSQILEACGIDALSYINPVASDQARGREALTDFGAVTVIPREPLAPGHYTVEMTVSGHSYTWRFSIRKNAD